MERLNLNQLLKIQEIAGCEVEVCADNVTKELELNLLNCVRIEDVKINRKLCIILNPNRYKSKASENFTKEILTLLK